MQTKITGKIVICFQMLLIISLIWHVSVTKLGRNSCEHRWESYVHSRVNIDNLILLKGKRNTFINSEQESEFDGDTDNLREFRV